MLWVGDRISTFYSGYLGISEISIEGSGAAKLVYYESMIWILRDGRDSVF